MLAGLQNGQDNLLEAKEITETLAETAGMHDLHLAESALSWCLGHFPSLLISESEVDSDPAASWEKCGAVLRREAHKLAATGSHDCTVVTKRVCLHQQAAEAFRRSGGSILKPLRLTPTFLIFGRLCVPCSIPTALQFLDEGAECSDHK